MENRTRLQIRVDALQRLFMVNTLSGILPLYIVTEYPKSGGSWLSQMISDYLNIPFPRNRRAKMESSLIHGHMLYSPMMKNVTVLYRDGRDVMVSLYYHMLFKNEKNSHLLVDQVRSELGFEDYEDIKRNLGDFIHYTYNTESKSHSPFKFTWAEFAQSWSGKDVNIVKYEDLSTDCFSTMKALLDKVIGGLVDSERLFSIVNKYSFENQSRRKKGVEEIGSFIRKGTPGDWKNKFSKDAAWIFNDYYGDEMLKLGYVDDDAWIQKLKG